jgi:hypothetical protein
MKSQHLSSRKKFLTRIGLGLAGAFSFIATSSNAREVTKTKAQDLPLTVKPARHVVARKTGTTI